MNTQQPFSMAAFHILLALAAQRRHGYGIMKQVLQDSQGSIKLGPGTLYGTIKKLTEQGLIEEITEPSEPEPDNKYRRYYSLTASGRQALASEFKRLEYLAQLGANYGLMNRAAGAEL